MAAGFRTRRIKTEGSIGDRLKRSRIRQKISVAEVEESTKIRAKCILALESDSWDKIPSEVYGRGYLETYVQFLGIDKDAIMRQYERERTMYARHCLESQVELSPRSRLAIPRFLLTPKFFVIFAIGAGVLGVGGVMWKQIRSFTSQPFLQIATPVQAKTVDGNKLQVTSSMFEFTGQTTDGAAVTVNGDAIQVTNGSFTASVTLHQGMNPIEVDATASNGKHTTQTLAVTVR